MGGRRGPNTIPKYCRTVADMLEAGAQVRSTCNGCGESWIEDLLERDPEFSFVGVREPCRHEFCAGVCGHRAIYGGAWPQLLSLMDPAMLPWNRDQE